MCVCVGTPTCSPPSLTSLLAKLHFINLFNISPPSIFPSFCLTHFCLFFFSIHFSQFTYFLVRMAAAGDGLNHGHVETRPSVFPWPQPCQPGAPTVPVITHHLAGSASQVRSSWTSAIFLRVLISDNSTRCLSIAAILGIPPL